MRQSWIEKEVKYLKEDSKFRHHVMKSDVFGQLAVTIGPSIHEFQLNNLFMTLFSGRLRKRCIRPIDECITSGSQLNASMALRNNNNN